MTQTYKVQVSMNQAHIVESGFVWKQGDFGFNIEIEVLDFDTTGATPQIIFRKSTGAVEATQISVAGNKFTYAIRGTELDTPGPCVCDLKLNDSTTKRVSTASFKYFVIPDTMDGLEQEASSYSDTIEQIVGGFDDDIAEVKKEISSTTQKQYSEIVGTTGLATNFYTPICKSREYLLTNNTEGYINLNVINFDGTYTLIESGIAAGEKFNYTAEGNYAGVRIYYVTGGTCVFESVDDGIYSISDSTINELASFNKILQDQDLITPNVVLRKTDLVEFPIPLGATFEISTLDGEVFATNTFEMYGSDGTTLINSWGLTQYSGNKRTLTNNSGNGTYIKIVNPETKGISVVLKTYITETDFLENEIKNLGDGLIEDGVIAPFVILRNTDLVAFSIPNTAVFNIETIDGAVFDTNSLKMYASDGTTLLNTWGLASYSGKVRTITNNSGDGAYIQLAEKTSRGIKVVLKTYATNNDYLETRIDDLENTLAKDNLLTPFVVLRETDLTAFNIPNKSVFEIATIDDRVFDTNSLKMYASDGTTLLNSWGLASYSGKVRTITNNSGDGAYIQLASSTSRGIKVTLKNRVAQPRKIRVMQYNIGMFNYGHSGGLAADVEEKISNYKTFLGEYQPDIACMEEYTTYIDSESTYASDATLFNDLYFFKEPNRPENIAIKTGFNYRNFDTFYVYSENVTSGLFASYETEINNNIITIAAGAIAAGRTSEQRQDGFEALLARYANTDNAILCVDTNVISEEEHETYIQLAETAGFKVANGGYFGMFDTYNLESEYYHKIDNIFVKGNMKLKNVIVPDVYDDLSSDHYPIFADIEIL